MEKREEEVPEEAQYIVNPDIISVSGRAPVSFDRVDQENLRGDGLGPTRRRW